MRSFADEWFVVCAVTHVRPISCIWIYRRNRFAVCLCSEQTADVYKLRCGVCECRWDRDNLHGRAQRQPAPGHRLSKFTIWRRHQLTRSTHHRTDIRPVKHDRLPMWSGGVTFRTSDLRSTGRGFDWSRRLRFRVTRSTQPFIPPVNRVPACMARLKAGRAHLCRVAGNTVWSHMAGDAP